MKKYNQLSSEEKDEIINCYYKSNLLMPNIAEKFYISIRTLRKIFKEREIYTRRKNRYTVNDNYFTVIDSHEKAYLLGLIAADGFVGDGSDHIAFQTKDEELMDFFIKELSYSNKPRRVTSSGFNPEAIHWRVSISSRTIRRDLERIGIHYKKSLSFSSIPCINKDFVYDFIRGYIDGDGSISILENKSLCKKNNKIYTYKNCVISIIGTLPLLNSFVQFLEINTYNISPSKTDGLYYLRIKSKKEVKKIAEKIYINDFFCLKRKKDKIIQYYNECL